MKFSTLIIAAVTFVGCTINHTCHAGDSNRSNKDIPGVAIANGSFNTLVAALSATDLVGAISSPEGPFTVLAPTDEAFAALPNGLVECLLQDQNLPILSDILLYHVASGEVLSTDLRNGMRIQTLLGEEVIVDLRNGGVKINDATVVGADVRASNGVIHVINQVLVPPLIDVGAFLQSCQGHGNGGSSHSMMPPPSHNNQNDRCTYLGLQRAAGQYLVGPTHTCLCTYGGAWTQCRLNNQQDDGAATSSSLVDIPTTAIQAAVFSTLVAALSATDLVGALSAPQGPFTVFAPTDEAFNALPNGLVSCLLEEQNLPILSDILLYHVASGTAFSTDLSNGQQIPTLLNGATVTVDLRNNGVKINESQVITADVRASNGVIHIIDQVLVPPRIDVGAFLQTCNGGGGGASSSSSTSLVDIPTTAINAGIFSTLVAALSATDLVGALAKPNGPYTVFAPLDDAFDALPNGLVSCLLEEKNLPILSDILMYHVASGAAFSTDLSNGQQIPTLLNGAKVTVDLRNNGVKINESNVITADVRASNGVIHIIDQVLVPPRIDVGAFLQTCGHGNSGGHGIRGSSSHSSVQQQPPYGHHTNNNYNNHNDSTCIYLGMQRSAGQYLVGPTHTCLCTHGGAWTQCRLNNHS